MKKALCVCLQVLEGGEGVRREGRRVRKRQREERVSMVAGVREKVREREDKNRGRGKGEQ